MIPYHEINLTGGIRKNNAVVNNAVDEILLNETQKVSATKEGPGFLESSYDENILYQVEKVIFEDIKETIE